MTFWHKVVKAMNGEGRVEPVNEERMEMYVKYGRDNNERMERELAMWRKTRKANPEHTEALIERIGELRTEIEGLRWDLVEMWKDNKALVMLGMDEEEEE